MQAKLRNPQESIEALMTRDTCVLQPGHGPSGGAACASEGWPGALVIRSPRVCETFHPAVHPANPRPSLGTDS